jgi:hypothetical protein
LYFLELYLQHQIQVEVSGTREMRPQRQIGLLGNAQDYAIGGFIGLHGQKRI